MCHSESIETFGSFGASGGAGRGEPLTAAEGSTSYVFGTGADIRAGQYTRATSPALAGYPTAWFDAPDHTGNPGGYMLVFDGDTTPGTFFSRTYSGLKTGSTYTFSAWIANIISSGVRVNPDVTMRIVDPTTNTVLGSYNTGAVPQSTGGTMVWHPYSLQYVAAQDTIRVELINSVTTNLSGNDLALDDVGLLSADGRDCVAVEKTLTSDATLTSAGDEQTWKITLTNRSNANAHNLSLVDALDDRLEFVSASDGGVFSSGSIT